MPWLHKIPRRSQAAWEADLAQGMGKYQWCIWGLCGAGYLLDLMWYYRHVARSNRILTQIKGHKPLV